jgi:signal transduction histidine kinase
MLRDISREKALQAQKDRFLANAAHELRTPISNIKTRLYLIRRQPENAADHLDVLETVSDNMSELVEDLLDVVRFERKAIRLHRKRLVLQELIRDVIAVPQPEVDHRQIRLAVETPAEPLAVFGDWRRLTQVVTKLIANAIHYSAEGGQVSVRLAPENGQAAIHVGDSGPGIAPDQLPYVFQPFFRAKEGNSEGLGLGLAIAQQIVELHGGTLAAESEVGRGSVFTVRLALAEGEVPEGQSGA